MQKTIIAITLALTLSSALAYINYPANGYVKTPINVADNSDLNYTNSSSLQLASVNVGELDLVAYNVTVNSNMSASTWNLAYRKLDGKSLSASSNTSATLTAGAFGGVMNGYVVAFSVDNDTNNVPQISVYQTAINGGAQLARILLTTNTNPTYTPQVVGAGGISKNVYVFYQALNTTGKVNVTSFTIGGTRGSVEFTLTTAYNGSLSVVWGEALGSSQLFASWMDGTVLKDGLIDVSKGAVTANNVGGWTADYTCSSFSTDKKYYGDLCFTKNVTAGTVNYYVRAPNTTLTAYSNGFLNTSTVVGAFPYGPYLAVLFTDRTVTTGNNTYGYELWNLDTYTNFKNRTNFVTTDGQVNFFRVVSGGLYTFTADRNVPVGNNTVAYQNIQVGLVLGSSYLTSVLGFIMTVVAGLLLF